MYVPGALARGGAGRDGLGIPQRTSYGGDFVEGLTIILTGVAIHASHLFKAQFIQKS
jgi:hypothetical protein